MTMIFAIKYNGNKVGECVTDRSKTLEEAIYFGLGIDINDEDDCRKAYEEKKPYAYLEDGHYHIDLDNMIYELED